jgi:hypothetical protein
LRQGRSRRLGGGRARPTITVRGLPQPPGGLFGFVEGHGIDDGVALLDIVDGKLIEL